MSTSLTVIELNTALAITVQKLLELEFPVQRGRQDLPQGVLDYNDVYREVEHHLLTKGKIFKTFQGSPSTVTVGVGTKNLDLGALSGLVECILKSVPKDMIDVDSYDVHHTIFKTDVVDYAYKAIVQCAYLELAKSQTY